MLGNLTIGLGFKSTYPLIDFADVCDLVKLYAEFHKNPVNNKLTNNLCKNCSFRNLCLLL